MITSKLCKNILKTNVWSFIFVLGFYAIFGSNSLFSQIIQINSDCINITDLPIVNSDGTGRNIYESGPVKIVWDNTNSRWLIKNNGTNMWLSNNGTSPDPPDNPVDWTANASACGIFSSLTYINSEVCDNGLDDDMDGAIDCNDIDCQVNGFYLSDNNAIALAGQDDFISNGSGLSISEFNGISDIAIDPTSNKVFVSDTWNHRVLRYSSVNDFINNAPAEAVFGQSDFTTNTQSSGSNKISRPMGIFVDFEGTLWVASYNASCVLKFNNASSLGNGPVADGVLGKSNFTSGGSSNGANGMSNPIDVVVDDIGTLWVSDYTNGRVLGFDNANLKSNGANADRVLGKPSFTNYSGATDIKTTGNVIGLVLISNSLFVSDYGGNRILRWDDVMTKANGADADAVIGQPSFDTSDSGTFINQFDTPYFLNTDADDNLYVCDQQNSRILVFDSPLTSSFLVPAKQVFGQTDFVSNSVGTQDHELNRPRGVSILDVDGTKIMAVSDYNNDRMIGWGYSFMTDELSKMSSGLPGFDATNGPISFSINSVELGLMQIDDPSTGDFTYTPPGFCPLNMDSPIDVQYHITNSFSCASTVDMKILVRDSVECFTSKSVTSCNETFYFDWYDGSSGFIWPISNGGTVTHNYPVTALYGGMGVDVTIDNTSGENIDYANCGTAGNHFYTATCNAVGASADCDGDPGTTDGQITMGCELLTMGMTSDNASDEVQLIFDFETPVMVSDLVIHDIDFEGSTTPQYHSWQDKIEVRGYLAGVPVNVQVVAGSKVIVENNFTPQVTIMSIYDPNALGGLDPSDPDGQASITTDDFIDSIVLIMSNGPDDDGLSDGHVIGISSFSICPKISENTLALCTDGIDNDLDGATDCNDGTCNFYGFCPDFDGDGVSNVFDKDDDNDGFNDIQESSDHVHWDYFGWTHNTPGGNISMDQASNSGLTTWFGQNYSDEQSNNVTQVILESSSQISDIASTTFEESLANGEYMFYQFETQANLIDPVINEVKCGVFDNANGDSFSVALLISDDSFASYTVLSKDVFIDGNPSSYTQYKLDLFGYYRLNENETYELRAYMYGMVNTGPGDFAIWDDFYVTVSAGNAVDFDVDGYDNHQDLDSDNDGLYDLLEAKGLDPDNDGLIGSGPISDPNNNGWSSICDPWDGGTVLTDIISLGIGLPDRINLDSDDDGCKDVKEAGYPDSNGDGILGGLPYSVDAKGKIIFNP